MIIKVSFILSQTIFVPAEGTLLRSHSIVLHYCPCAVVKTMATAADACYVYMIGVALEIIEGSSPEKPTTDLDDN